MDKATIEKYQIKKIIRQLLINSNNDVLLADYIMSYVGEKKCYCGSTSIPCFYF